MRKEALVPVLRVNQQEEREALRCEGLSLIETFYEGELQRIKQNGFCLVYICAPLKETEQKTAWRHIREAVWTSSQILGSRWKGKDVTVWLPHLHALTVFNEIGFPEARRAATEFNFRILRSGVFDTLVISGNQISEGMRDEIRIATDLNLEIVHFEPFVRKAKNIPSLSEAIDYQEKLGALFTSNIHHFFIP